MSWLKPKRISIATNSDLEGKTFQEVMFNRKKTKIPTFNNIKNPCILQFFDIEQPLKDNEISIDIPNIFHEIIIKNNTYFYNYLEKQQDLYKNIEIDNKYLNKNTFIYSYFFIKETKLPPKTISLLIEHFCFYGLDSDNLVLKLLNIPLE